MEAVDDLKRNLKMPVAVVSRGDLFAGWSILQ
jgi:hypothetical protein